MAPEVLLGAAYDFKADVWSLGVTLYHLLTGGSYPFKGDNKQEIYAKIQKGDYEIESSLGLSAECLDFLSHCLQYDQHQRASASRLLKHPFIV
jgi:serine/threonine protein kinase